MIGSTYQPRVYTLYLVPEVNRGCRWGTSTEIFARSDRMTQVSRLLRFLVPNYQVRIVKLYDVTRELYTTYRNFALGNREDVTTPAGPRTITGGAT